MNLLTDLTYPEPLVVVPQWNIHDSTKIKCFLECPRKYFWNYILGWETDKVNIHFLFGEAWHELMEYLLLKQGSWNKQVEEEAFQLFCMVYMAEIPKDEYDLYSPKDPAHAYQALQEYMNLYKHLDDEVLYTEIPGVVPIDEERVLHFKIDAIMSGERGLYIEDHKTGSQDSKAWRDQWRLDFQISCYTHVLFLLFPDAFKFGAVINGTILRKKGPAFIPVEVAKSPEQLQGWLWEARYTVKEIEHNHLALSQCSESDPVMMAFPRRTTSCTKFGTCPYIDFCCAWQNPIQKADRPPVGIRIRHWDPTEKFSKAKRKFEDGKIVETSDA